MNLLLPHIFDNSFWGVCCSYNKVSALDHFHFTGIDDPYEVPKNQDLSIDTNQMEAERCVQLILKKTRVLV